jgi:hypothetical protein
MWTAAILALAMHGKLDNVVGLGRHSPAKLVEWYGDDCEPILTGVGASGICVKTETCVDIASAEDNASR